MKKSGTGSVIPPGTIAPQHSLPAGTQKIQIKRIESAGKGPDDGVYATCLYPDGWEKDHQVQDVTGLFEKIVNTMRWRYGAGEVKLLNAPKLEIGTSIKVEI